MIRIASCLTQLKAVFFLLTRIHTAAVLCLPYSCAYSAAQVQEAHHKSTFNIFQYVSMETDMLSLYHAHYIDVHIFLIRIYLVQILS